MTPTMPSKLKDIALWAALFTAFWFVLNDSLTGMTHHDCKAGVVRACNSLKGGHQ